MNVKFGVFADLHTDIMHDGEARMTEFLEACRKEDVDFVVLDGNYGKVDGKFVSYENGNYFDFPKSIPYLSDTQLSWLEKDLEETKYADLGKYSAEIDEKFPDIRHVIPYDKPLYTIVTITDAGAEIKGCKAEFVGKTPDALGINEPDSGFVQKGIVITSDIQDRFLSFEK